MTEWDDPEGNEQKRKDLVALPRQVRSVEGRPGRNVLHAVGSVLCVAEEQLPLTTEHGGGYTSVREQDCPFSSATRPAHQCLDNGQLDRRQDGVPAMAQVVNNEPFSNKILSRSEFL